MTKKAWRLIFAEGLLQNYINGSICYTLRIHRPGSNDFEMGQIIEGHFKEGIMLLLEVLSPPEVQPFNKMTPVQRRVWNHHKTTSHSEMMDVMKQHNPGVKDDEVASLIELRLARVNGRPIAGPLPELP